MLKENPKYTKEDLMRILNKADGTIKGHLSKLKEEGVLNRVGSTKGGHWEVNNDET
ncbi:transcriptional regulator [bacterium]|nr:transcriptional regulator [bacterium]